MFYDNLVKACEKRNVKISVAVQDAGEKLGSLSGWKKGATPNAKAVCALSEYLGVSTDFLLKGIEYTHSLTDAEHALLSCFRDCSEQSRAVLLDMALHYAEQERQAKEKDRA